MLAVEAEEVGYSTQTLWHQFVSVLVKAITVAYLKKDFPCLFSEFGGQRWLQNRILNPVRTY